MKFALISNQRMILGETGSAGCMKIDFLSGRKKFLFLLIFKIRFDDRLLEPRPRWKAKLSAAV